MSATHLINLTVDNPVVAPAATASGQLTTLAQVTTLLAALFKGAYDSGVTYAAGQMVSGAGALWLSKQDGNHSTELVEGDWWTLLIEVPAAGVSAYLYVAYASAADGTGFNLTPSDGLPYIAVKNSTTVIASPQVSDFTGLWRNCKGATGSTGGAGSAGAAGAKGDKGDTGDTGPAAADGADGANGFLYTAYASAADGTGFSLTPDDTLPYIAVKNSTTVISSPAQSDFTGLWRNCKGPTGDTGDDGSAGAKGDKGDTGDTGSAGAKGDKGDTGTAGVSAYVYFGYANDASGTGFSTSPGSGLYYLAAKVSATVIASPAAGDFTGLWVNTRGATGATGSNGSNGADGADVYGYTGYASDTSGTAFSATPGDGLNFIAIKLSATPIVSPGAADFTGLWRQYAINTPPAIPLSTDDLPEGTGAGDHNLYFTSARVLAVALAGLDGTATGAITATDTVLSGLSKAQNRLTAIEAALASPGQALFAEGTISVATATQSGAVTGLALGFTPSRVQLTVQIPSGGFLLFAVLVGAPTTDGFAWSLNANTDATTYRIHYRIT